MAQALTIGQLARATGVAAKTIRYYEQVGVLPRPDRTAAGYRQYTQRGVHRLRFVRRARALGLPLRRLKALGGALDGAPREALRPGLRDLIRAQLGAVQSRIAELERLQRDLEEVLQRLRTPSRGNHAGGCRCLDTDDHAAP